MGPRTVRTIARWLVSQPDTCNWIYRGGEDAAETHLITVEMPDHSRRVLRDSEIRTGDLRWGYTGTGAHSRLYGECPNCFGAIPFAADVIQCKSCFNSGIRPGTRRAEGDLLIKVIDRLPEKFERTRLDLLRAVAER